MDVGFAGPRLVFDGFDYSSGFGDVVEAANSRFVVSDVLGANKAGSTCFGAVGRTNGEMIMRATEPIHAIVSHLGNIRV